MRVWLVPIIKDAVERWLHTNADRGASKLVDKIQANERLRTELSKIKKEARERAKSVALRIPKLTDCKVHFSQKDEKPRAARRSSLFITEGDSAGGSAGAVPRCRDVQAIYKHQAANRINCYGLEQARRSTRTRSSTTS